MNSLATPEDNNIAVAIITGTHSAGKSTLLTDIEEGEIRDFDMKLSSYEDFGYATLDVNDEQRCVITVPETARWLADTLHRPDLLADNYDPGFQGAINVLAIQRIHEAIRLTGVIEQLLVNNGTISRPSPVGPIVVSDRGPLDGLIYSTQRSVDKPKKSDGVEENSRELGFFTEWTKRYVDVAILVDHKEVPFDIDAARSSSKSLRSEIGRLIKLNYDQFLPRDVVTIRGNEEERKIGAISILSALRPGEYMQRSPLDYTSWKAVELHR